jgi:hypothetical protein
MNRTETNECSMTDSCLITCVILRTKGEALSGVILHSLL